MSMPNGGAAHTGGKAHDRSYMQDRLREEIARAKRYGTPFAVIVFEATASDGAPLRTRLERALQAIVPVVRPSDVVALVFEDTIAVLLVQTSAASAKDALLRMRDRVAQVSGSWSVTAYTYPRHEAAIEALPLLTAA
jgi:GGDEF domain-containing protein